MVSGISLEDRYTVPGRHWHPLDDGRVQCDVCPRACRLHEGQRGLCFVRGRVADQVVLTSYGWRASQIPDTGPNKVGPGTEDDLCENGVESSRLSSKTRP